MAEQAVAADYVIKGAGAAGMAFADAVLTESDASVVIVDRRDRPGGHWNDAYPFVACTSRRATTASARRRSAPATSTRSGSTPGSTSWPPARRSSATSTS